MTVAAGIDLSTRSTGLVVLQASTGPAPALLKEQVIANKKLNGIELYGFVIEEILKELIARKPDIIVLEGYSLNMKNPSSVIPLVEIGGLLRFMLKLEGFTWYDPRATELKKFVSGSAAVKKDQMMMFVLKKWGHTSTNSDTADAYGLACMGLAQLGALNNLTVPMKDALKKMVARNN